MEKFYKLFINKLKFSYDSLDRIVLNGYITSFHQATTLEYYFKNILGHLFINHKLILSITARYNKAIEAYAHKHKLSCEWAKSGVRKDQFVAPTLHKFQKDKKFGVYYILRSKENEGTFRVVRPNQKDNDKANYLAKARKPYGHYYFYIHDKILGNMCIRVASYLPFKTTIYLNEHSFIERYIKNKHGKKSLFTKRDNSFVNIKDFNLLLEAKKAFTPDLIRERLHYWLEEIGPKLDKHPMRYDFFIDQIEYCRNFIFKSHDFLNELFKRSCELSLQLISTDNVRQIFASKAKEEQIRKGLNRIEQGYYVFKAYFKRCSVKKYRKHSNFLRYELTCNHLPDLKLKKALEHLPVFEKKAEEVLDRYSETEAEMLNVHAEVDYFTKHASPVMVGQTKISGIHVYQPRIHRMMEVLLHDNRGISEWKSMDIRRKVLESNELAGDEYSRNQVIYDVRKLRAHGLVEKLHRRNAYRLTSYGMKVALGFTLMRKRIYGPFHYSLFENQVDQSIASGSKLERLYRRLDSDLNDLQDYLSDKRAA